MFLYNYANNCLFITRITIINYAKYCLFNNIVHFITSLIINFMKLFLHLIWFIYNFARENNKFI